MNKAPKDSRPPQGDEPGPTADLPGPRLGAGSRVGHFRVEREIGRGGMGIVYLAHDAKLGRRVAIKSLPPQAMNDPQIRSRMRREAKVLAALNHPNVAAIYEELEESQGVGYLVLEYVPGQTLAEKLKTGPLPRASPAFRNTSSRFGKKSIAAGLLSIAQPFLQ
jgi:serine/threonine-protein kinase